MGTILLASAAIAERTVVGDVEVAVYGRIEPYRLPRTAPAPIAVFLSGHLSTTDGKTPPQLQALRILLNRHGLLQSRGLVVCRLTQIQPASTQRALSACGSSLIGAGQFWAEIVLPGQPPYPTEGRLLAFNGRQGSSPVVFVHIYTENPFNTSFVITFAIRHVSKGPFTTELNASLPEALGTWGYVNRIKMTLAKKYRDGNRELSYFNAACPAAKGFRSTTFQLAQASFYFAGAPMLTTTLTRPCAVR